MIEPSCPAADPEQGSLAERANHALLALADRADRKKTEAELSAITAACTRAEALTARLASCMRIGVELASLGLGYVRPSVPSQASKAIPNLRRAATQAADPSQDLTERLRSGAVQDALKAAETTAKLIDQALIRAAEAERARLTPADLHRPIATMPGNESLQARIRKVQASLSRSFTGPVAEIPAFVDRWRQYAEEWEDTRHEVSQRLAELPAEIKAFVEAAASERGAPWSMLTAAVREWLDTDDHGDGYEVRKW
ncbi:hypothetical protein Acor_54700 [Acrocarpospora corrugata]|uniref:Uncharacterized protein n=1 Tax=Acrocarpospora corrugata TaxID=35763 RepID=A0A5M3W3Q4_9ACTN|nr:hypothetical protein [Acrocarpospora corrugata]GES03404.1 hypothetical protein Acor_54700 [Acrocarpospora corrugata]